MLNAKALTSPDLQALSHGAISELAANLLTQLRAKDAQLQQAATQIGQRDAAIKFKDAKIERITFELARLKAWRFAARTEAMNAQQRQMFEDTLAEDQASLEAQLQALQGDSATPPPAGEGKDGGKRKPRCQALPEHSAAPSWTVG